VHAPEDFLTTMSDGKLNELFRSDDMCVGYAPSVSSLHQFLVWLAETSFSTGIRESTWSYPIIESVHVLGLTLFLGFLLVWDCRLVGIVLRNVAVSTLWKRLIPWITAGALIMVVSGTLLFVSDPVRFYGNLFFRLKVAGLVLAAVNAAAFHFGIERRIVEWDTSVTPLAAKLAGGASMFLWAVVVVTGRLVAYNWFAPIE
jgi:hypothetical protein